MSPSSGADSVTTSWFLAQLIGDWDIWASFEEVLLNIPEATNRKPSDRTTSSGLALLKTNVQTFAYAIAAIMPWRKHPEKPFKGPAKTLAGSILRTHKGMTRSWNIIDSMIDQDDRTMQALEKILEVDSFDKGIEFQRTYGEYWGAHVLCAAMFSWAERAEGNVEERKLEELWNETREYWRLVAGAVDRVRWESREESESSKSQEIAN
jgi:hypothetical protein